MQNKQWLPWQKLMAFGLGQLKLSANQFWSMTLREMDMAIEGGLGRSTQSNVISNKSLNALMETHPDMKMDKSNE